MENMATNGNGLPQLQAQEILCFFYDNCTYRPIVMPDDQSSNRPATIIEPPQETPNEDSKFAIYPNPAQNWASIILPERTLLDIDEQFQITVLDLNGRQVYTKFTKRSMFILETDNLSSGTYIIQVLGTKSKTNFGSEKIIIQH